MGAIASGGTRVVNLQVVRELGIPESEIAEAAEAEQRELERRERAYRGDRPAPDVRGRTVVLVDDGLATGSTMKAAIAALRTHEPAEIVMAVPVAAPEVWESFRADVDDTVCVATPRNLVAVGLWYEDFSPTTDDEVRTLLERARQDHDSLAADSHPAA
jgi:putative phosphoribosyl transferase